MMEMSPAGPHSDVGAQVVPEVPDGLPLEESIPPGASAPVVPDAPDGPEQMTPKRLQPAGFLRRVLAFSIDLFIMQFLYFILYIVGVLGASRSTEWDRIVRVISAPALAMPFIAVWFVFFVGYFSFFHACGGQTPAKMLIRIKVVTGEGEALSRIQSLCRTLAYFLSSFFFGFGFLLSIVERKKRGLHDLLTRSQVVLAP